MQELIKVIDGNAVLNAETASKIAEFERQAKHIKEQEDALKEAILSEMEVRGIVKIDTDELTISYIFATDRETFDTKAFKRDHIDMFDEYIRMTPVKSSIRIKVK